MVKRTLGWLSLGILLTLGACQTAPQAPAGYLSSYDGMASPASGARAAISQKRDDRAVQSVSRVFIQPAILVPAAGDGLTAAEHSLVLREVDRQICYEISERFEVAPRSDPAAATVKTFVVRVAPTGRVGSGASAVANLFNPVPGLSFRAHGSTGGLTVESEMLAPDGTQIAAISWSRNATVIGTESPSFSRVGDALQLAEPMGDAVGAAFAAPARPARKIETPDPCARYGPRRNLSGEDVVGVVTGVYVPEGSPAETTGTGTRE